MSSKRKTSPVWLISKYTLQTLLDNSNTIVEVLSKLGLSPHTGNHRTLNKRIDEDNICVLKFNINRDNYKQLLVERLTSCRVIPNSEIFVVNSTYNSGASLKKRMVRDMGVEYECSWCCNKGTHNGKNLSLQLDHINGINNDNRLDNLRLLCPNCHSQTKTFAGKRKKVTPQPHRVMCGCGGQKSVNSTTCKKCVPKKKKFDPTYDELFKVVCVDKIPFTTLGGQYGVSDNAVRKRCIRLGIDPKKREKFNVPAV
jgi:hypothetical protein